MIDFIKIYKSCGIYINYLMASSFFKRFGPTALASTLLGLSYADFPMPKLAL
jgi:hypothetical protein